MKLMLILTVQALLTLSMASGSVAANSSLATDGHIVKGDVLMREGEFYIIKDITGHEVRVHVNAETKMDGHLKTGDKIEATLTADGHATSIRLQDPQESTVPAMPRTDSTLPPQAQ